MTTVSLASKIATQVISTSVVTYNSFSRVTNKVQIPSAETKQSQANIDVNHFLSPGAKYSLRDLTIRPTGAMTLSETYVEHHRIAIYDADRDEEKYPAKPACLAEDERSGEPALSAEKFQTVHERL